VCERRAYTPHIRTKGLFGRAILSANALMQVQKWTVQYSVSMFRDATLCQFKTCNPLPERVVTTRDRKASQQGFLEKVERRKSSIKREDTRRIQPANSCSSAAMFSIPSVLSTDEALPGSAISSQGDVRSYCRRYSALCNHNPLVIELGLFGDITLVCCIKLLQFYTDGFA
jgi:hypothetical protein